MDLQIGQQVICVNDQFSQNRYWRQIVRTLPKLHTIYTIREICNGYGSQQGLIGLCFYEIVNPMARFGRDYEEEPAYNSKHFRPVRKVDIEQFKKLLVPIDATGNRRQKRRQQPLVPA